MTVKILEQRVTKLEQMIGLHQHVVSNRSKRTSRDVWSETAGKISKQRAFVLLRAIERSRGSWKSV